MITEQERKRKKLFGKKRVYGIREVYFIVFRNKEKNN